MIVTSSQEQLSSPSLFLCSRSPQVPLASALPLSATGSKFLRKYYDIVHFLIFDCECLCTMKSTCRWGMTIVKREFCGLFMNFMTLVPGCFYRLELTTIDTVTIISPITISLLRWSSRPFLNHQESNRIADTTWGIQTPPACPSIRPKKVRIRDTFRPQVTYESIGQPPGRFSGCECLVTLWQGNVESERVMVLQDLWLHIVYRDT